MRDLISNIKFAWRGLLRSPGFLAVAILTLTLGIAANTATFNLVNTMVLRPLPFHQPDRLVWLDSTMPEQGRDDLDVSYPDYRDWKSSNHAFTGMSAVEDLRIYLSSEGGQPVRVSGAAVSPDLFSLLGVEPLRGRLFDASEATPGREFVTLVSQGLWRDRFGGDAGLLGKSLRINGGNYTVVGIMPPRFKFPEYSDVWIPLAVQTGSASRDQGRYSVVARLRDGVSVGQAQREMETIAAELEKEHPTTNKGRSVSVRTLRRHYTGDTDIAAMVFFGVTFFVLLIAIANIANLLLIRATERQRDIALKSALGASRIRLAAQLLTESLLLAALGVLPGIVLGQFGLRLLLDSLPVDLPFWADFSLDYRVVLGVACLSLLAGLLFGVAPIRFAWRNDLSDCLKTRTTIAGRAGRRLSRLLVAAEVALALSLLAGAGLMLQGFLRLNQADPGFQSRDVVSALVAPFDSKYETEQQRRGLHRSVLEEVGRLPAVRHVASSWSVPLQGGAFTSFSLAGEGDNAESSHRSAFEIVSPEYFGVLRIPLVAGRAFEGGDREDGLPVCIVNQAFAALQWQGEQALGKQVRLLKEGRTTVWRTVVGVVGNVRSNSLDTRADPTLYVPYDQHPTFSFVLLADAPGTDLSSFGPGLRSSIRQIDPDLPVERLEPLDEAVNAALWQPRTYSWLFGVFAVLALVLAMAGIYGIVAYSVSQRTQEIAVRMALGARVRHILKTVLGQTLVTVLVGLVFGILGALALGQVVAGLLPAMEGGDPITIGLVALLFLSVAAVAGYFPARRATRVDPLSALREE